MHRIDGPGATVDNKFTDGDPVGGVQATIVTDDWANDVQEELMSFLAAAGITPVKGTQNQVLSAVRKLFAGVVGSVRNGRMVVATASASATYTADEVVVKSALGGQAWLLPSFSKSINLASTGAGGMDTGTAPVNGYVALYAIYNPTTLASALLAVNATSIAAPHVYGGANLPSGYTVSALLTVVPTNGSSQFKVVTVRDRIVGIPVNSAFSTAAVVTNSPVSVASFIPLNAVEISGELQLGISSIANIGLAVTSDTNGTCRQSSSFNFTQAGQGMTSCYSGLIISTPQTIVVTTASTGGAPAFIVAITEYRI